MTAYQIVVLIVGIIAVLIILGTAIVPMITTRKKMKKLEEEVAKLVEAQLNKEENQDEE